MLKKEFKMWPTDPISDATLLVLGMYISNLDYLENGAFYVTKLPDSGTEELDLGLGLAYVVAISDNNN